jgi:hypothetical protein
MTWQSRLARLEAFLNRFPWLLPAISFAGGWLSFIMVRRGADAAQLIALIAILGWAWLLIEPLLRRWLERRRTGIGKLLANFISQSLQQEVLFFTLPLIIGATQKDAGQMVFATLVAAAAIITTIDPVYERYIAARAARRLMFHAYCSWIAALVVLPIVVRLPLERALPVSLAVVGLSLVLTLPLSLSSLKTWRQKAAWLATLVLSPLAVFGLRSHIPAAGLAVTGARITQSIAELTPGPPTKTLSREQLAQGVIAFAAIRAPAGLSQSVVFEWRHAGDAEQIAAQIHGGSQSGFRTYSRKQIFPSDAAGRWIVDIRTPQGQLLKRMSFTVSG